MCLRDSNNQDPAVPLPAGCDERNPTPAPFEITAEQKAAVVASFNGGVAKKSN